MTGKELQRIMAEEEIPFTLVKIRVQCIMNRTYAMIAIRQWIRDDAPLPEPITREALLHSHCLPQHENQIAKNKGASIFG